MSVAGTDPWFSITNASHYALDGMPLKVNENYKPKPPKKESLPAGLRFAAEQSTALNFKYDFETEHGFIKWYDDVQKEKQEQEREKTLKLKQEADRLKSEEEKREADANSEKLKSLQNGEELKTVAKELHRPAPAPPKKAETVMPVPPVSNSILQPERASPVPAHPVSNAILQPERASPVPVPMVPSTKAGDMSLRDFENLGEDPFDSAELKTINDMEVLQSVLSNSQNVIVGSTNQDNSSSQSGGNAEEQLYMNPAEVLKNHASYENVRLPTPASTSAAAAKRKGPVASPRTSVPASHLNSLSQSAQFNSRTDTVTIKSESKQPANVYENNIPVKPKPPPKPKPISKIKGNDAKITNSADSGTVQSLANALSKDLDLAKYRPPGAPKGFSYISTAASTKMVDTDKEVKDIEWPSLDSAPATPESADSQIPPSVGTKSKPPTRPASLPSSANNGRASLPQQYNTPSNDVSTSMLLKQKVPPAKPPPPKVTKMPTSPTKDDVLSNLLAMGFDKRHVDSAMKHFGTDTKQLIDHLCAIQQLVTDEIKWESAQQGLLMFNSDLTKAGKFAHSYQKLTEFGFEDEKIKDALINCDMDMDKALERLVP